MTAQKIKLKRQPYSNREKEKGAKKKNRAF